MKNLLSLLAFISPFLFTGFYLSDFTASSALPPCSNTTWEVTTTGDNDPAPSGSLREAVEGSCPGDTIIFDITLSGDIQLIDDITIDNDLVIFGNGSSANAVDGQYQHRCFHIVNHANVEFHDMKLINGSAYSGVGAGIWIDGTGNPPDGPVGDSGDPPSEVSLINVLLDDISTSFDGGGIYNFNSDLYLDDVTFDNCDALINGGGLYSGGNVNFHKVDFKYCNSYSFNGGGIFLTDHRTYFPDSDTFDPVVLEGDSLLMQYNSAYWAGGAIYVDNGQLDLNAASFMDNEASTEEGGAIYLTGGHLGNNGNDPDPDDPDQVVHRVINGYFVGNASNNEYGGAVYAGPNIGLEFDSCAFFNNYANEGGGAIACGDLSIVDGDLPFPNGNDPELDEAGYLSVRNSLFMSNEGDHGPGGAILNTVPTLVFGSYIVDNNADGYGGGICSHLAPLFMDTTYVGNNEVRGECDNGPCYNAGGGVAIITNQIQVLGCSPFCGDPDLDDYPNASSITNSMIKNNFAVDTDNGAGGGLYVGDALHFINMEYAPENDMDSNLYDLYLADVTIEYNVAEFGGGMMNAGAGVRADRCEVRENYADETGGGIYNAKGYQFDIRTTDDILGMSAYLDLNDCEIEYNRVDCSGYGECSDSEHIPEGDAEGEGGGLFNELGAFARIDSSSFYNNCADDDGGGISMDNVTFLNFDPRDQRDYSIEDFDFDVILSHTEIDNNYSDDDGGGIHNEHGAMWIDDCTISDNYAVEYGGGVYNEDGLVLMRYSIVDNNNADEEDGGGIHNEGEFDGERDSVPMSDYSAVMYIDSCTIKYNESYDDDGGGISNDNAYLKIVNSVIRDNESEEEGGGIYNYKGYCEISASTIEGNDTDDEYDGGGIMNRGEYLDDRGPEPEEIYNASMFIDSCIIRDNYSSEDGGGINNREAYLVVRYSTLDSNDADFDGGGLENSGGHVIIMHSAIHNNEAYEYGGGISNYDYDDTSPGQLFLYNSTVSNNLANEEDGGGIYHCGDTLWLDHCTIAENVSDEEDGGGISVCESRILIIGNSVVANNHADEDGDDICDSDGDITSLGYNLVEDDDENSFPIEPTDTTDVDPGLDTLGDHGGFTYTHKILCGSIAYNAANPASTGADQRGESVWDSRRDMGAFEAQFDASDADGDGYCGPGPDNPEEEDCDDNNPDVYPGLEEVDDLCGDGIDNNCDGVIDEGPPVGDGTYFISGIQVLTSGYNNFSGPDSGYGDYTLGGSPGGPCLTGTFHYLILYPGALGPPPLLGLYHWGAWVDWNDDGWFDNSEKVIDYCTAGPFGQFFMNPPGTPTGQYTLRVITVGNSGAYGCYDDVLDPNHCYGAGNGETEDYSICVGPIPGIQVSDEQFADLFGGDNLNGLSMQLEVFPNPFNDILHLDYRNVSGEQATVEIIDANGKMYKRASLDLGSANGIHKIDTGSLPGGMYMIRFITGAGTVTKMVVKQ